MKPIIGVMINIESDGTHKLFREYIEALEGAGGIPVLLTYTEDDGSLGRMIDLCDGLCFSGGVDLDPSYYGQQKIPECGEISEKRDDLEMRAARIALERGKPLLGICRGAQLLNVAMGGELYQDIRAAAGSEQPHQQAEGRYERSHFVSVKTETPLAELLGEGRLQVNSFHHQAVSRVGAGLAVMAYADDGIVEALYGTGDSYVRLYQWHPERLVYTDGISRRLFSDFVSACDSAARK